MQFLVNNTYFNYMKTLFNFGWKHLQPLVVMLEPKNAQLINLEDYFDQQLLICTKQSHLIILKCLMSNTNPIRAFDKE
jgi:hypothetical protein